MKKQVTKAELIKALEECQEALHDIIGAADNNEPYSRAELAQEFLEITCNALELLERVKGVRV